MSENIELIYDIVPNKKYIIELSPVQDDNEFKIVLTNDPTSGGGLIAMLTHDLTTNELKLMGVDVDPDGYTMTYTLPSRLTIGKTYGFGFDLCCNHEPKVTFYFYDESGAETVLYTFENDMYKEMELQCGIGYPRNLIEIIALNNSVCGEISSDIPETSSSNQVSSSFESIPESSSVTDETSSPLSAGAIIGIVFGIIGLITLSAGIGLIVFYLYKTKTLKKK